MRIATPPAVAGGTTAERELACYEGVRAGRRDAFTCLVVDLDAVLRDLALAASEAPGEADDLVRHAWRLVLGGLDLFAWRCSLRAWVVGMLRVLTERPWSPPGAESVAGAAAGAAPVAGTVPGPVDWRDLPWGARWSATVLEALEDARAALPPVRRQVLVLVDVHGWDVREAGDALGLTAEGFARELGAARLSVHDRLVRVVGEPWQARCGHDRLAALARPAPVEASCPDCALLAARWRPVVGLLAATASRPPPAPDPEIMALFRQWRATRRRSFLGRLAHFSR